LPYLPEPAIAAKLDSLADAVRRFDIKGYRSPALLTSPALDRCLDGRFSWSSSAIDTDVGSLAAPRRGCCSVFPFWKGSLLEIPVTIPMDDRLLSLGIMGEDYVELIVKKAAWISEVGGVAVLANHAEPHLTGGPRLLELYRRVLGRLREFDNAWFALPSELAAHWERLCATSN